MDRTAWIVVTLCSLALVILFQQNAKQAAEQRRIAAEEATKQAQAPEGEVPEGESTAETEDGGETPSPQPFPTPAADPNVSLLEPEQLRLTNAEATFQFNQVGGGIESVTLLNHRAFPSGNVMINQRGPVPIGTFTKRDRLSDTLITYRAEPIQEGKVVFTGENPDTKIRITKTFSQTADPYTLDLKIDLLNQSGVNHSSSDYYLHTGALEFLHRKEMPLYLSYNWCSQGEADKEAVDWFKGGGIIFRKPPRSLLEVREESLQWAGASNQFYTSLVVPTDPLTPGRVWAKRFPVTLADAPATPTETYHALYGALSLPEVILPNEASASYTCQIYTGPRELKRLEGLGHDLKEVMHYDDMPIFGGMFGLIPLLSTTLLKLMIWLSGLVHNWGIAILIITCLIRILIWPLHAKSTATMKRMSKLAPLMTELKEKHADDPQKMQQETMKLYRDYGVNPVGGCLPVFLQLPIFLSFYKMLQSAVELRDQHFLWVEDLSMPDAIYHFESFSLFGVSSINLMPLLMAATMIVQMKIGPKAGDKMQQRIFMLMPLIFLFICYNFASALALYWTGQNIFSIGQTWWMNRRPEPELVKRPAKKRMSLQEMQKAQQNAAAGRAAKKPKKRTPRTGG